MDSAAILLTGIGLAVAAGLNAYIPLLIAGLLARFGVFNLDAPYDLLESNLALLIIGTLLVIEVVADKVPVVDSVNDVIQTVMRPASGALLFAGAVDSDGQWVQVLALIAGLVTAGAVHGAKATARPVINASTAGIGGPVASVAEDGVSLGLTFAAIFAPLLVLIALLVLLYAGWKLLRGRRPASGLPSD